MGGTSPILSCAGFGFTYAPPRLGLLIATCVREFPYKSSDELEQ